MSFVQSFLVLLGGGSAVLGAPYQLKSSVILEVCQFQVDTFGGEHEVICIKGDKCVEFPLVPHMFGIEALVTRKMLRKDVWQNGEVVNSSKTKLGICKKIRYHLPRTGKVVPNHLQAVTENRIEDEIVFPMSHNTICKDVSFNAEEYLVKDPEDCTKFYSCQRGFNGAYKTAVNSQKWVWLAYHMVCPLGTVFDGERCQVGSGCQNKEENLGRQVQEHKEVKGLEEGKHSTLLIGKPVEKDFEIVAFTEPAIIILDTSNIKNEFDVTHNEEKSNNNQRIISTKTTSTIIKDIPNNEFAETENLIPVESHSAKTTETIVKKIPTRTTSAVINESPDNFNGMAIEGSEVVHPMVENMANVNRTEDDINEEEMKIAVDANEMKVLSDSTTMMSVTDETSTLETTVDNTHDELTNRTFSPLGNTSETTTVTSLELGADAEITKTGNSDDSINDEIKSLSDEATKIPITFIDNETPVEFTSKTKNIYIEMKTITTEAPVETPFLTFETTINDKEENNVEITTEEENAIPLATTLSPIESVSNDEEVTAFKDETDMPFDAELLPVENKSNDPENTENVENKIMTTELPITSTTFNSETHLTVKMNKDENMSVSNDTTLISVTPTNNDIQTTKNFVETTTMEEDAVETTFLPVETTTYADQITTFAKEAPTNKIISSDSHHINIDTTLLPVRDSVFETPKNDVEVTNNEVKDEATSVFVDVTLMPNRNISVNTETGNNDDEIAAKDATMTTEVSSDTAFSQTETISKDVRDTIMNDETTVAPVDTMVSFVETANNDVETRNNEAEATAMNDETTSVPVDSTVVSIVTTNQNRDDSTVSIPVETIHLFPTIKDIEVKETTVDVLNTDVETTTIADDATSFTTVEVLNTNVGTTTIADDSATVEVQNMDVETTTKADDTTTFTTVEVLNTDVETTTKVDDTTTFTTVEVQNTDVETTTKADDTTSFTTVEVLNRDVEYTTKADDTTSFTTVEVLNRDVETTTKPDDTPTFTTVEVLNTDAETTSKSDDTTSFTTVEVLNTNVETTTNADDTTFFTTVEVLNRDVENTTKADDTTTFPTVKVLNTDVEITTKADDTTSFTKVEAMNRDVETTTIADESTSSTTVEVLNRDVETTTKADDTTTFTTVEVLNMDVETTTKTDDTTTFTTVEVLNTDVETTTIADEAISFTTVEVLNTDVETTTIAYEATSFTTVEVLNTDVETTTKADDTSFTITDFETVNDSSATFVQTTTQFDETTKNEIEAVGAGKTQESIFVPVEITIVPDHTTQKTDSLKLNIESERVPAPASVNNVLVENKTNLPITNTQNMHSLLPENEIFLQFFNEEGSGAGEETEASREPRVIDDPVLKFVTYRSEQSVSKVERV